VRPCSARGVNAVNVLQGAETYQRLLSTLWPAGESSPADVYVILDGARDVRIASRVESYLDQKACLYEGTLPRELTNAAPHLLRLFCDDRFCRRLIEDGWGHSWGVFAIAPSSLTSLRRHFRKFMVVRGPNGNRLVFRWYDPRVLRVYLPTCNVEELRTVFGPIEAYVVEGREAGTAHRFAFDGERLTNTIIRLDGV
jgi:Domain of unknown function (DUF4123)